MNKFRKVPVEHFQIPLDPANATTGLIASFNVGAVDAYVRVHYYIKTEASAGKLIDIGYGSSGTAQYTNFVDGASAVTGAQGGPGETIAIVGQIVPAGNYINAFNVATSTPTVATGLVGYLDIEIIRYPVRVGDQ